MELNCLNTIYGPIPKRINLCLVNISLKHFTILILSYRVIMEEKKHF